MAFPTVLFTLGVIWVLIYWFLVLVGRVEPDMNGPKRDPRVGNKFRDIPPAVVFTSLAAQAWFWTLLARAMFDWDGYSVMRVFFDGIFVAVIALCLAYVGTIPVVFVFRRVRSAWD
ncbi:hypothetical protein AB0L57_26745 [Nocardia sp. NPDC052254]|uniref:hypothetical protein n=1 Tax=Nocardia sp. NPDC052254 TaxID=3155681 RepID=UPI00341DFF98